MIKGRPDGGLDFQRATGVCSHYEETTVSAAEEEPWFRKSRRFLLITTLVAVAALVFAAAASAATVSPETQTVQGGDNVYWTGYWSGTSPFDVTFYFGDGAYYGLPRTISTQYRFGPHQFYPCYEHTYYRGRLEEHRGGRVERAGASGGAWSVGSEPSDVGDGGRSVGAGGVGDGDVAAD